MNPESAPSVRLIFNPMSGSTSEGIRERIEERLREAGIGFDVGVITPEINGGELAVDALERGAERIIVSGGDGTLMAVANGIARRGQGGDLAIVPGGTANLIAAALGVPSDIDAALEVALTGERKSMDLGRIGDLHFALGAGIGIAERLIGQADEEIKEHFGRLAYALAALREVGRRPRPFVVVVDGERRLERAVAIVVANVGGIGFGIEFAPDARPDDGRLDVCVLHRFTWSEVFRLGWKAIFGGLRAERAVHYFQGKRIEIRCDRPMPIQLDGDVVGLHLPATIEVVEDAFTLRVPAEEKAASPA